MNKRDIGKQGERMALNFLEKKGYRTLETNYHKRSGEIDIITMSPEKEVVFVEVKMRTGNTMGYPEESVTEEKIEKIIETGLTWLDEKEFETDNYRIDIIAIEMKNGKPDIVHLENIS